MRPVYSHADVGAARTRGASPLDRRAGAHFVPQGDDITRELEENLERLTLDIPDAAIDDLLMRYQRSTVDSVGVPGRFSRLLRRVAQAVMCYHEHH